MGKCPALDFSIAIVGKIDVLYFCILIVIQKSDDGFKLNERFSMIV